MEQVKLLRRRTTDLLAHAQQNMASTQQSLLSRAQQNIPALSMPQFDLRRLNPAAAAAADPGPHGTWERIDDDDDIPALRRSAHSLDIVAGCAYIFGGELADGLADNDMHVVRLPASGASTDYLRIKAVPETPDEPAADDDRQTAASVASSDAGHSSPRSKGKGKERAMELARPVLADVPAPRAGHATAVIGTRIFLFGGHSHASSSSPDNDDDDDHTPPPPLDEAGRVWVFDTRTRAWSHLDPAPAVTGGAITIHPAARSFHCAAAADKPRDFGVPSTTTTTAIPTSPPLLPSPASPTTLRARAQSWRDWAVAGQPQEPAVGHVAETADDEESRGYGTFFIHAGRLASSGSGSSDIWAFDVHSRMWSELPAAPGPARDGAAICISKSRLFRFGGASTSSGSGGGAPLGGQLDYLPLEVETMDDRRRGGSSNKMVEVAVRARDGWQTIAQHATSSYSSTVTPLTPLSSPRRAAAAAPIVVDAEEHAWPCPRAGATLSALTMGGGREALVLAFGDAGTGSSSRRRPLDDVWLFWAPPQGMSAASVTAAVMQAVGRKTGEGRWARVAARPYDEDEHAGKGLPPARARLAGAPMNNLEDSGLLVWGGVGEDGARLGDGWVLRL
ncbi:Kelch repeat type 1 [Cordyceps militaris CM01]|uniref:Kelch repeat type 1 n=1 Tax=Cordyceps militaris (strain CM01) TaxID=983644 RepID=G3J3A2_CORMM|nr:Kelch repeat type 1 [Cordyceps militaris CM01]EGX95632.1 Kelch repeat type 1 [Cordyceps militaris CM01]